VNILQPAIRGGFPSPFPFLRSLPGPDRSAPDRGPASSCPCGRAVRFHYTPLRAPPPEPPNHSLAGRSLVWLEQQSCSFERSFGQLFGSLSGIGSGVLFGNPAGESGRRLTPHVPDCLPWFFMDGFYLLGWSACDNSSHLLQPPSLDWHAHRLSQPL